MNKYVAVLKEEMLPAMGCTEPICLAYAAAKAREVLGLMPEKVIVLASGNIIKNVKSVIVPNTDGQKGIQASVAAGIVAGDAGKALEVIANVTSLQKEKIRDYMAVTPIELRHVNCKDQLDVTIIVENGNHSAEVRIVKYHTNIVTIKKDGEFILKNEVSDTEEKSFTDRTFLTVDGIVSFADTVDIEDVRDLMELQVKYNMAIAEEGLKNKWGANIGGILLKYCGNDVRTKARAYAAAGSDARMNGCEMPVVINSGSGNQGMTVCLPIVVYAREYKIPEERMLRALVVSNLIAVHLKTPIGRLSAYCGAVSAGCAAACGIAYMLEGTCEAVSQTLSNSIAIASGIVCDGAKASCAAKISASVDAGLIGYEMYKEGRRFANGDGLVGNNVEKTIENIGLLGSVGMKETDSEIIDIMVNN